jgi:D-alanyl-D-alanine carboxypeptidase
MMNRRPTKRKSNNTTLTLALILAIAIIANIFIYGTVISDRTPADTVNLRKVPLLEETEEAEKKPENLIPQNYSPIQISSDEVHAGELILVSNKNAYVADASHAVVKHETPADVYANKTKDYYILDTSIDLNPTVINSLNTMFADYKAHSGSANVMINAAYRTLEQQAEILEVKGPEIAANPGYSEHHSGYAFDICIFENGKGRTFADEEPFNWIPQNCKKYGFIRRYPDGKKDITGIDFEPWHFRYVGVPHSYYIAENNLVLEEYMEIIKSYTLLGEHLAISAGGTNYEVYYVPATEGITTVYCPSDKAYTVSGNNTDGFIVTVNMTPIEPEQADNASAEQQNAQ